MGIYWSQNDRRPFFVQRRCASDDFLHLGSTSRVCSLHITSMLSQADQSFPLLAYCRVFTCCSSDIPQGGRRSPLTHKFEGTKTVNHGRYACSSEVARHTLKTLTDILSSAVLQLVQQLQQRAIVSERQTRSTYRPR